MWKTWIISLLISSQVWAQNPDTADAYFAKNDFANALREYRLLIKKSQTNSCLVLL